jgi:N utilization substance protein B
MGRKLAREEAMKLLYQMEMNNDFSRDPLESFLINNTFSEDEKEYIDYVVSKVIENKGEIDKTIDKYAQGWKINRIAKVDLSTLRIAISEILYRDDIPIEVSINEAIEISKKYSTDDSSKFINGVLGSFVKGMNNKDV